MLQSPRPDQVWLPPPAAPVAGTRSGTMPVSQLGAPLSLYAGSQTLLGAGATVLAPLSPSPVAGFATCNQIGYEVTWSVLQASAGATSPFVQVVVSWFDDDQAGAQAVDTITYYIPAGQPTAAGTFGHGPMRGQYMSVAVVNTDPAQTVTLTVKLRGCSRSYTRDDWRWPASQAIPGYVLPLTGSAQGTLVLASVATTVPAASPQTRLLPLFTGRVRARLSASTPTANAVQFVIATVNAQPGSVVYSSPTLGAAVTEVSPQPELSFPRDLLKLTATNSDGANVASIAVTLMAEEY